MMNNIAIITNEYSSIVRQIVDRPIVMIEGSFDIVTFKKEMNQVFKQQYLDILVIDATALKDGFTDAISYLKMNLNKNVRIIVLYPNMDNEDIYKQLLVYGIYDIVAPNIDKNTMSDTDIEKKLVNELSWVINEPTGFAKVVDKLKIDKAEEAKPKQEQKEKTDIKRPRLIGFYKENDAVFDTIRKSGIFNIIAIDSVKNVENIVSDIAYADLIVIDEPDNDFVDYIISIKEANDTGCVIVAGTSDPRNSDIDTRKSVRYFVYDGSAEHFARQTSIVYSLKDENIQTNDHKIYVFSGVKGGTGTTSITALSAINYARRNPYEKVVVVDFSAQANDTGEKFGIDKPDPNLYVCVCDFIKARKQHLDIDLLKDKVKEYTHYISDKKVYVLPCPYGDIYHYSNYLYKTEEIADIYRFIIRALKEAFDVVFVDTSMYGGFPYEIAMEEADKVFLVGDGKLSSLGHMLNKIKDSKDTPEAYKTFIIMNRLDTKHNENEVENLRILQNHYKKARIIELPYDRVLQQEEKELGIVAGRRYKKAIDMMWDKVNGVPPKKRGILWKR